MHDVNNAKHPKLSKALARVRVIKHFIFIYACAWLHKRKRPQTPGGIFLMVCSNLNYNISEHHGTKAANYFQNHYLFWNPRWCSYYPVFFRRWRNNYIFSFLRNIWHQTYAHAKLPKWVGGKLVMRTDAGYFGPK